MIQKWLLHEPGGHLMNVTPTIKEKLRHLPGEPGVYLMKDSRAKVLYVGKAKNLRYRVTSYFTGIERHTPKTRALVREISDFDIILVKTEVEALLLERTLIKHNQPPFNILLRDDKEYPYLRVDFNEAWPRLEIVRQRKDDGAFYAGPFSSSRFLRVMMGAAYRIFPLIRCTPYEFKNAKRPCNYYHMKLCLGPCTLPVPREQYDGMIRDAVDFIQGKNKQLVKNVKERMAKAAEREEYELAAMYRDQIQALEALQEKQTVVIAGQEDADVIGVATGEELMTVHVLMVRGGKLLGADAFILNRPDQPQTENIQQFLLQYYDGRQPPKEIIVPLEMETAQDLAHALCEHGPRCSIIYPQRGPKKELLHMAERNAQYQLDEATRKSDARRSQLEILQQKLGLPKLPRRMECIDISNFQETAIVASNVCFMDAKPEKSLYRRYVVNDIRAAPDDFGSIREVVRRRIERGLRDHDFPDLLVIDGGQGQLNAALEVLDRYPDLHLPIISLAKSRVEKRGTDPSGAPTHTFERIYRPGDQLPLSLAVGSPEYRLMTQIRDEAHRFAITHHRSRRKKELQSSLLEKIPGIGPKLRKRLLEKFGSLENISKASLAQLLSVPGMRESIAVALHSELPSESEVKPPSESEAKPPSGSEVKPPSESEAKPLNDPFWNLLSTLKVNDN